MVIDTLTAVLGLWISTDSASPENLLAVEL